MANAQIGALRVDLAMNAGRFERNTRRAGNSLDDLNRKAKALASALAGAFAIRELTMFAKNSVLAFGKQEEAIGLVNAVLSATGKTAGFTSKRLQEVASELQEVSKFGDEEILRDVTANFLTFGNIVGPVFERAQKAALNLSTIFKVGLKESTIQLGKALNDPLKGISALSRVGIAFTAQQKTQIETLIRQNKVMEAQGVILDEVAKFYDKFASAAANSPLGKIAQTANALGDAFEDVGEVIFPVIEPVLDFIKDLAIGFQNLSPEMKKFIVTLGATVTALSAGALAAGAFVAVLSIVGGPITAVIASVSALTAAIVAFWPNLKKVAGLAYDGFKSIYDSAFKWLVTAFRPIIDFVNEFIRHLMNVYNTVAEILGLDVIVAKIQSGIENAKVTVKEGMKQLGEIWHVEAEKINKQAEENAPAFVVPTIKLPDGEQVQALRDAQNDLVEDGVRLAESLKTPYDILSEKVKALQAAQQAGKITADQYANAQAQAAMLAQNSYATMASDIAGSLQEVFGESKAFAIVSALINTYEGFTKALATYPPPFSYAAAGATLAAGLAKVAAIRSAKKNSTGGSGGGSSVGASSSGNTPTATTPVQQQSLIVQGVNPGDLFTGESVRALAGELIKFQQDGGRVVLAN